MVEIKSCSKLASASALCAIEQEVKGDNGDISSTSRILAELQRERQKNAELMQRISLLETQLQERNKKSLTTVEHENSFKATEQQCVQNFKRQKAEIDRDSTKTGYITEHMACPGGELKKQLVNWMSIDQTQVSEFGKFKKEKGLSDDTDRTDEEDSDYCGTEEKFYKEGLDQDCEKSDKIYPEGKKQTKKMPFSPKEVKRILESNTLLKKNAQSHTMRKILVFASLGTRHGCDDMYEIDFNHFRILRKGESKEHVLYENPGVLRKIFYPNKENPTLCPVKILEEEKGMRPNDPNCPSYLFLCIKYGGNTRNLPQNEYVRQRMGRNKLKSFGPLMCRMGKLVHGRGGSFFFKALGITLLFMAGFSGDLVQRETEHGNFDLLHKYYRTDEETEGEELFLSDTLAHEMGSSCPQESTQKPTSSGKPKGKRKKQTGMRRDPQSSARSACSSSLSPTQHNLIGSNASYPNHMVPCSNMYWPVMYWPPYGFGSFPPHLNYVSVLSQPCYSLLNSNSPFIANASGKKDAASRNDISSDSTEQKEELPICKKMTR